KLKKGSSFVSRTRRSDKTQLFGQPLFKICPDEHSLPKPVTEMLVLLRKKGPSTEGVFRKPCNRKNMRELREQLDNGLEVDLEAQPAVLLVGLIKSFLKELPGSLLISDLYDDWMAALDSKDHQQRVLEVVKVADKLPGPNKALLKHLICVFHHILESAETNKMDARNLAVCVAPTLLHLNGTPLDEQREKIEKVTELTQFLLEHFEILGENIPDLLDTDEVVFMVSLLCSADSISTQHHDSAYDSTDPDGDAEGADGGSSTHGNGGSASSLSSSSFGASPWQPESSFNRRCSEPIILLSPTLERLGSHVRSHDDCSVKRRSFEEKPLKKQISDDSFLLRGRGRARSVLSFPKLTSSSNVDALHRMKDSCSSLESAASNQSEGSVFTSSPAGSPGCSRRTNSTNQPSGAAAQQGLARPILDKKRHSHSTRVATKVLLRTRSLGAFNRNCLKDPKNLQKEISFPCETLQEDSQCETDPTSEVLLKPRPLSAIEVFRLVDSRLPCRPPPYEHAVQSTDLPPRYGSMTVHDAMERRSRPSSVNYDRPPSCSISRFTDCFNQTEQVDSSIVERRQAFRQRAMSESVSVRQHEAVLRRCSQPVFEEFSYAKESYV
uniref:T cell activation RhoGTPase activating protein b n=1 Tax=Tetraodon nigroviridis TaxID=99883 RepID=H3CZI7_TETNG